MESEDVAAVNVLKTGERAIKARNINIDDLRVFTPVRPRQTNSASFVNSFAVLTVGMPMSARTSVVKQLPSDISSEKTPRGYPHQNAGIQGTLLESNENSQENKDRCEMLSDGTRKKNQWPIGVRPEISCMQGIHRAVS
jgi:hypothetical protein